MKQVYDAIERPELACLDHDPAGGRDQDTMHGAQPCWRCYTYSREPAPKDAPAHTCVTVAR
jgi:hypothetical protein